jgi:hypothetical protein
VPKKSLPRRSSGGLRRSCAKPTRGSAYGARATTKPAGAGRAAAARSINAARASRRRAWLHHVIKAMREGKSQSAAVEAANFAAPGYRERVTISWPNCPFWEPLEFFMRNDGTMIRTVIAPAQPDIDPQFIALAASPWLPTALHADAKT